MSPLLARSWLSPFPAAWPALSVAPPLGPGAAERRGPVPWVLVQVAFPDTPNAIEQRQDSSLNCSSQGLFFQASSPCLAAETVRLCCSGLVQAVPLWD